MQTCPRRSATQRFLTGANQFLWIRIEQGRHVTIRETLRSLQNLALVAQFWGQCMDSLADELQMLLFRVPESPDRTDELRGTRRHYPLEQSVDLRRLDRDHQTQGIVSR